MKRRTTVIAAAAAVALLGAGAATTVAVADDETPRTPQSSVRVADDDRAEATRSTVTAEKAVAAALAHTPGTAAEADLDADDGNLTWDVTVIGHDNKWHDIDVDPTTAEVIHSHTEHDDDNDAARVAAALKDAPTSAQEAAKAAAAKGKVTSVEADDDGNVTYWEVETEKNTADQNWHVNLTTGKVTPAPTSDDD
ncbi:PepSY domain-containing protein [Streptomyces sp. NPDC052225]|uniref:PepSY domain-containing protein n=1 Tax=Streptomyces sp. NPDC052225 TaxID=3154949 RepID=UPI003441F5BE